MKAAKAFLSELTNIYTAHVFFLKTVLVLHFGQHFYVMTL